MFEDMLEMLKKNKTKLVFPEGLDERVLEAAGRLKKDEILEPILLGCPDKVMQVAKDHNIDIAGIEIINPENYAGYDSMVAQMVELRKGKMTEAECREALKATNYFGTMLVRMGVAQGLLGGATYSTADTVRPALQIVKTKPGNKIVSSCFILNRVSEHGDERYAMADCAINLDPNEDELVEIAIETAGIARLFGIEPKVALLSYSSLGSGKGASVDKMRNAVAKLKEMDLDFPVDGELQFDAAFCPEVGKTKAPNSEVAGRANTFIFPDIDSGNIGYKIAQRLGNFEALGPILMGLNAPINDLSRGTNTEEIYKMAIITAAASIPQ